MTPLRAARSSYSGNSSSPTIIDLKLATSLCTSPRFLPTRRSAIIAAEGVEEVLLEVIVLQFAPVAGSVVMVHEDLCVELAHHTHLANAPRNRRAPSSAVSRASTSSSVL